MQKKKPPTGYFWQRTRDTDDPQLYVNNLGTWCVVDSECKSIEVLKKLCHKRHCIIIQTFSVIVFVLSFGSDFIYMIRQVLNNIDRIFLASHISYVLSIIGFLDLYQGTVTTLVFTYE